MNSTNYQESWQQEWHENFLKIKKRCSRCLYDEKTPNISFDSDGVCNYCRQTEQLYQEYPAGAQGEEIVQGIAEQIKKENKNKKFDVIVGVSGGCDSSFLVHKARELGLRPLAVHYDNTWNSTTAVENIHNVLKKLDVELYTYVVDNEEYDDIYRAFLKAGVPDLEAPTDIGFASTLYMAAEKYKIKHIFEGHSFRTEGICPLGWLYMDPKYIQTVHSQFGDLPMKTFPNMWLSLQLKWRLFKRIKLIRPLYHLDHNKKETKEFLKNEFGWQWYGGHHLENRITSFYHTYFLPRRFGIDLRLLGHSALIRAGQMTQEEGLDLISRPPEVDYGIVEMVKKRLGLSDEEFETLMTIPKRSYKEFKTYKQLFEKLRPLFWSMYKMGLVPKSFYIKYACRQESE